MLTADTITDEQIRELLEMVVGASPRFIDNDRIVKIACLALGKFGWHHGVDCRVAPGHERATMDMARASCAKLLNTRAKEQK